MKHIEYKRIKENADTALLFVHGIAGTPNHFNIFMPYVPDNVSVYNMLLDGHGKSVRHFSNTSMPKWEKQVNAAVEELCLTHSNIFIIAHSMGTLFAVEQAIKNKKIKKLFLLASPLKLFLKPQMFQNSLKVYFNKINPSDPVAIAAKNCYGIDKDKNIFNYFGWIPRYIELFKKIKQTRKSLCNLSTDTVVFQSQHDELVSLSSINYLNDNPHVTVNILKNSTHYFYSEDDKSVLIKAFNGLFEN